MTVALGKSQQIFTIFPPVDSLENLQYNDY